ncbi:hypothetical protein [Vibrio sp. WXL210]|uniref:hypothetical protein n=1 Tax=Vibrio sp. WXL210 TaxID=3450709 RepID=UPI003EC4DD25
MLRFLVLITILLMVGCAQYNQASLQNHLGPTDYAQQVSDMEVEQSLWHEYSDIVHRVKHGQVVTYTAPMFDDDCFLIVNQSHTTLDIQAYFDSTSSHCVEERWLEDVIEFVDIKLDADFTLGSRFYDITLVDKTAKARLPNVVILDYRGYAGMNRIRSERATFEVFILAHEIGHSIEPTNKTELTPDLFALRVADASLDEAAYDLLEQDILNIRGASLIESHAIADELRYYLGIEP